MSRWATRQLDGACSATGLYAAQVCVVYSSPLYEWTGGSMNSKKMLFAEEEERWRCGDIAVR